jgi:hypothetical protein
MSVKLTIPLALAMIVASGACAQWTVPTTLQLDGPTGADKQVHGLASPVQPTEGANTVADRNSTVSMQDAAGINDLTMSITPAPTALVPGMRVIIRPISTNTGAVTLDVNGLGAHAVLKYVNAPLDSADLRSGVPIQLVYDGASFQVATQLYPGCPTGTKAVGRTVCIEVTSREPANWYSASALCVNDGMRLCGFSDWIQACLQFDNIFSTVLDYEWVDEAANSTNLAKLMGVNEVTLLPDCRAGGHRVPTSPQRFRCCYDR